MITIIMRSLLLIFIVALVIDTQARSLIENCDTLKANSHYGKTPRPPPPAPKIAPPTTPTIAPPTKETSPLQLFLDTTANKFTRPTIAPPPPPKPSATKAGQLIVSSFGVKWNITTSNGFKRPSLSPPPAPRVAPPIHHLSGGDLALSRQPPNVLSSSA